MSKVVGLRMCGICEIVFLLKANWWWMGTLHLCGD